MGSRMDQTEALTARQLRATYASCGESSGPSAHTIDTACALVSETANGITSVKIGFVGLDPVLERLARTVAERLSVRLVLRPRPSGAEADLVIEQAIEPVHHQPRQQAECPSLLAHLIPRFWSKPSGPNTTSRADARASTMKELP